MSAKIGDLMSKSIEKIDISANAHDAAKKMRDKKVSSLIIADSSQNVGIVTERDLVWRVCATEAKASEVPVRHIMSSPIATIDPNSPVEVAADNMIQSKVRHLLVENEQGAAIGVITLSDLAAYMKENVNMDEVNATILNAIKDE